MNPNLVDLPAIAELLGVTRQRAGQLAAGPGFPAPVAELTIGRVWTRESVEEWAAESRRGPGRPRKPANNGDVTG